MPEPCKCQLCQSPATVHLTQIVGGKMLKVDLCESCAQAKGVTDPDGFSLADILQKAGALQPAEPSIAAAAKGSLQCEQCGLTPADYKRTGRLGCPACYGQLRGLIDPMLVGMHRGVTHTGKRPGRVLERESARRRADELERQLQAAIREERYEDAAALRDALRQHRAAALTASP